MLVRFVKRLKALAEHIVKVFSDWLAQWAEPGRANLVSGAVGDVAKSQRELIAENTLLRQQLIVLQRQVKRPRLKRQDRLLLVVLASKVGAWRQALLLVKPETLLGWHRDLFGLVWKRKTTTTSRKSRVPAETIALIKQLARENRLWGAERVQGELLKLDIKLAKRTIQKHMRSVRSPRPSGQTWSTFLKTMPHKCGRATFCRLSTLPFGNCMPFSSLNSARDGWRTSA